MAGFPTTRRSLLEALRDGAAELRSVGFAALVESYWRPVYKYARLRFSLSREDAEDLTQGFFARAFEKSFFERYDPARARFRTYVRTCLDGFAANEWRAARREKRGGGAQPLSLDFAAAEGELVPRELRAQADLDAYFQREWARALFALAVEALRARCAETSKQIAFELFRRYDLEGPDAPQRPSYQELAQEHALPVTQVTNHLAWARREFRKLVLEKLRELTASEQEFRMEARELLGVDPP